MNRIIKKQFWFNRREAKELQDKARKACLSEAALIRYLVVGYEPKCDPSEKFYIAQQGLISAKECAKDVLKNLENYGSLVAPKMKELLLLLEQVEADMEEFVLVPEKVEEKWR